MSDNRLEFDGMEEFRAALRQLPIELSGEGGAIVVRHGTEAGQEIIAQYPDVTGNLKSHVKVEVEHNKGGAIATVKSTAKHAFMFENGTQVRHTQLGKNLGAMPAANIFVPTVIRKRREMTDALIDLMERAGLEVTVG